MRISDWSSDVCSSDLTVADITPDHALSRITIVTNGPPPVIDQIIAQLDRLVPVHKVTDLTDAGMAHVEREIALVKVAGTGDKRIEALRMADVFRAKVVDTTLKIGRAAWRDRVGQEV